jgi:hypothetical protein
VSKVYLLNSTDALVRFDAPTQANAKNGIKMIFGDTYHKKFFKQCSGSPMCLLTEDGEHFYLDLMLEEK